MFFLRRSGSKYFHRGDPTEPDYVVGNFTKDGTWYSLDLSAIIPVNAKLVLLKFMAICGAPGGYVGVRKNGAVDTLNIDTEKYLPQAAVAEFSLSVTPDSAGIIEYKVPNLAWPTLEMIVGGWFC